MTDPVAFLSLEGDDWDIGCAVVRKAQKMQQERRRDELTAIVEAIGGSVGNRVAEVLARMLR